MANGTAPNRGESDYERISWDEAADIVTDEIKRIKREYGPAAIMSTPGSHHLWGHVGYRHSALPQVHESGWLYLCGSQPG